MPGRSDTEGKPFLCAEVKTALLTEQFISTTLEKQLFPYMDLSHARYGVLVSTRTGTDGKAHLDTHLVDRDQTCAPLT